MRTITFAILGAWLLISAGPALADGWCWAAARSCPGCDEERTWRPRRSWNAEASREDSYHEIFGDGPGPRSGRHRRRRSKGNRSAKAGAPAAGASVAPPPPPPDTAAPPPVEAGK